MAWSMPQFRQLIPSLLAVALANATVLAQQPSLPKQLDEPGLKALGFDAYRLRQEGALDVDFYVSPATTKGPQPLVVFLDGSGCQSLFATHNGQLHAGMLQMIQHFVSGSCHLLATEKPGVKLLDQPEQPGSSIGASKPFLEHYTPKAWGDHQLVAIRAAQQLLGCADQKLLLVGMSDGGHMASHLAANSKAVTHTAILSCGGPTQLFDLLQLALRRTSPDDTVAAAEKRRQQVLEDWRRVQADPLSTEKFWMGHPYRRWSTFAKESVIDNLKQATSNLFVAYGTHDQAVPMESHEMLVASLLAHGREVTVRRVEGGGHAFEPVNDPKAENAYAEMDRILQQVLDWFQGKN